MNPLSPFTYYRRHKGQALLLLVLIGSLTLGVFVMVGVLNTFAVDTRPNRHLTRTSRILDGQALDPSSVTQLRAHPDIAAVLPENGLTINSPSWAWGTIPRPILGITEDDLELVMGICDLRLKEGRLIEPRAAEIILSEEIVRVLGLQIGDVIGHDIDEDLYPTIATELTLVGILESVASEAGPNVEAGFISYEYLESHEAYQPRLFNLLLIPQPGRRLAMNELVQPLVDGSTTATPARLETFEGHKENVRAFVGVVNTTFAFTDGVVAVSAALVVGMVNRIAITRRLPELGLLHAAGYTRRCLVGRLVLEVVTMAGIGWAFGLLLSITVSALMNASLQTGESVIDLARPVPYLFTLPVPLAVIGWVSVTVYRVLSQLDPIAIIERGKLSMEEGRMGRSRPAPSATRSSRNPLSSWTFYRRHRRRSLALLVATGLMVMSVTFPAFVSTVTGDSLWPVMLSYVSHTSIVSPATSYQAVDPAVLARIRGHPAVARVIPVKALTMMVDSVTVGEGPMPIYGVREGDLPTLLDACELHLGEGALPQPRAGQIVLTRAPARNRGLSVGDVVGRPIQERDGIPTEMTVVGLLDSSSPRFAQREGYRAPIEPRWAGFFSYEFAENHEAYGAAPMHALVLPVKGCEAEVETWLEDTIRSPQVTVETFGTRYRLWGGFIRLGVLLAAISESILAAVVALALAILNTIFCTQRRDEFGILHAAGHSRAGLIGRTVWESVGIAGAAWLIGAVCCLVLLVGAQTFAYVPKGMNLNLINPTPWLFTLPIPVAVVAASAGTTAWALSRLDPVAVIERR